MKKIFSLLLAFSAFSMHAVAQSGAIYIMNDCLYESLNDGESILFHANGTVEINGRADANFRCYNNDGAILLYHKGRLVNTLTFDSQVLPNGRDCTLRDKRGICYALVSCGHVRRKLYRKARL